MEATELARPDARPAGPSRGRPGARPGPHITGGRRSHVPTEGAVPSFTLRGGDNCHSNDAGREAPGLSSEGRGRAGLTPARAPATVTCDLRRARGRVLPSCSGSASAESGLSPARAAQGDRTGGRGIAALATQPPSLGLRCHCWVAPRVSFLWRYSRSFSRGVSRLSVVSEAQ